MDSCGVDMNSRVCVDGIWSPLDCHFFSDLPFRSDGKQSWINTTAYHLT